MTTHIAILIIAGASMLSSVSAQQPTAEKPPVGVPADAKLFNGKWYRIYLEKKVAWNDAKRRCATLGGQLACVPDAPTQAFIVTFAKGLNIWLGATDEKVEGLWVWVDGTEMKFTAWGVGQPDNGSSREHYLRIYSDGKWNDARNDEKGVVGYICEWKDK